MHAPEPQPGSRGDGGGRGRQLFVLWLIVSILWTVATLMRVELVWVPQVGWLAVLHGSWIWLSLFLPLAIFGALAVLIWTATRGGKRR